MNAPRKVTREAFVREYDEWVDAHAHVRGDGAADLYLCRSCNSVIQARKCYISIHFIEFPECTGPGRVDHIDLPFCPTCEPERDDYGCVHVRMPQRN